MFISSLWQNTRSKSLAWAGKGVNVEILMDPPNSAHLHKTMSTYPPFDIKSKIYHTAIQVEVKAGGNKVLVWIANTTQSK